jgi:hypothetical protein
MCRSTLSLTSALGGGGWLMSCSGCFTPWKESRYPSCKRWGGPRGGWSQQVGKMQCHTDSEGAVKFCTHGTVKCLGRSMPVN